MLTFILEEIYKYNVSIISSNWVIKKYISINSSSLIDLCNGFYTSMS